MSAWIFLRGLTREARHWGDFPAIFRAALPDAEIAAPDLPGNGRRWREESPLRIDGMVEHWRGGLAQKPPYSLLALSLGAMAAVDWAHRHPEEISRCVLINTSLRPFSPFHRRLRPQAYPALLRLALAGIDDVRREREILRLTASRRDRDGELPGIWAAYRRDAPVSRRNALRQLIAAARYRGPREKPAAPLLLLAGARDRLVDWRCSEQLARAWDAPFVLHPDGGHDLPLDDGPWVARTVAGWVADRG